MKRGLETVSCRHDRLPSSLAMKIDAVVAAVVAEAAGAGEMMLLMYLLASDVA